MLRRLLVLTLALVVAAPAQAAHSFVLTRQGAKPALAVDRGGTGHFVWDQRGPNGASITHYCRVLRSGRVHSTWVQGRALRYRRTSKSASRLERTHVLTHGASYFDLAVAAGANGRGWVAWDANGPNKTVRAIVAP